MRSTPDEVSPQDPQVTEIQMLYPRVYMACHTEHVRAASSKSQISARDSAILAHLSAEELTSPSRLARHLGISLPTLSEATARLAELGYLVSRRDEQDERRQRLSLTPRGIEAMKHASVLDSGRLAAVLSRLSAEERKRAVDGLALLARAAVGSTGHE